MSELERFSALLGTWTMVGRTLGADADDIAGEVTIEWALDGELLALKGDQVIKDFRVRTLELVWHDPEANTFPSHVYGGSAPLEYRWDIHGAELLHGGLGATYRGTISGDGSTITGGWRPDPGTDATAESAYDVTMTRIR
jgi:hypothetical protein